jgi:hypothetical protein
MTKIGETLHGYFRPGTDRGGKGDDDAFRVKSSRNSKRLAECHSPSMSAPASGTKPTNARAGSVRSLEADIAKSTRNPVRLALPMTSGGSASARHQQIQR